MVSASARGRKTSTTSTGASISNREEYTCSPKITPPLGLIGMIRYPRDWMLYEEVWPMPSLEPSCT